jgi:hypothetical protein
MHAQSPIRRRCGGGLLKYLNEEGQNCINRCVSEECFDEIYALDPLEDGEVDLERGRVFTACVRRKYREGRKKKKVKGGGQKEGGGGG